MKILTKDWVKKHDTIRIIHNLKEINTNFMDFEKIIKESKNNFYREVENDIELAKLCQNIKLLDKLYQAKIQNDRIALLTLPKELFVKISNPNILFYGYSEKEDKDLLLFYCKKLLCDLENEAKKANSITEISEDYLPQEFVLDEVVGELAYEEYIEGNNYYLNIGEKIICVEDYKIIERENFKINKWEENNPLTLWTALISAELHYNSNNYYELHLLLVDGDKYANKKYWYFTLEGTNIKYY